MSGLFDSNLTDSLDQTIVVLKGGSDNATIGNIGDAIKVSSTPSSGSIFPGIDYHHYQIHLGNSFIISNISTLSANDVNRYVLETTSKYIHIIFNFKVNGIFEFNLYENPTITTTSTVFDIPNKNRNSANTSSMTRKLVTAYSNIGTLIHSVKVGDAGGNATSNITSNNSEIVLKLNTKYLTEYKCFTNNSYLNVETEFYQI